MSLWDTVYPMVKSRDMGAQEGEQCPFCKREMNVGASTCTGCGADRYDQPNTLFQLLLVILVYASVGGGILIIVGIALLFSDKKDSFPVGIICTLLGAGIIALFFVARRKVPLQGRYYKTRH